MLVQDMQNNHRALRPRDLVLTPHRIARESTLPGKTQTQNLANQNTLQNTRACLIETASR